MSDSYRFPPPVPPFVPPPPPPRQDAPHVAEFIALKAIVMVLVLDVAKSTQDHDGQPAQATVNAIAERCIRALHDSDFASERIRSQAIEHVTGILAGIKLPKLDGAN